MSPSPGVLFKLAPTWVQGELLDEAHEFVVQLADIYDYVTPCFPERYRIIPFINPMIACMRDSPT